MLHRLCNLVPQTSGDLSTPEPEATPFMIEDPICASAEKLELGRKAIDGVNIGTVASRHN